MAKRRKFTPQFKATSVIEALTGQSSQAELCRRYNLSEEQLSKWKHQLLDNAATLFESTEGQFVYASNVGTSVGDSNPSPS